MFVRQFYFSWSILFQFYSSFNIINARNIPNNKIRITREIKSPNDVTINDIIAYMQKYGHLEAAKQKDEAGGDAPIDQNTILKNGIKRLQKYMGIKQTGEPDKETKKAILLPRCGINQNTGNKWEDNKRNLTFAIYDFHPKLDKDLQRLAIRTAFNRWASVSTFKFHDVTEISDITPDIKVGFFSDCHGDKDCFDGELQVLAHGYYPEDGHLHFDLDENWAYPNSAAIRTDISTGKYIDLLEIATHEIGHILGVEHIPNTEAIMSPGYNPKNDSSGNYIVKKLHALDIEKVQELYGVGTEGSSRGPPILSNRKRRETTSSVS
uniref:Peptidase metallopeptidase domain-containing protein n=1 Tax=Acrobeloides nanus TaxID=290746 RepID=A0A914DH44_9BILA